MLLVQMLAAGYRIFRKAEDPLYQGLGLGFVVATCACIVTNCFGDRWTYIEITGLLWILAGACLRANQLMLLSPASDGTEANAERPAMSLAPHLEWR
jgi:putative inorganic carbon (HCO3(-)) transporter